MTDNNVFNLPTPMDTLAERIRAAYQRTEYGRKEWIEGTLELAAELAEARRRFPADRQFAHWVVDADLECIGHQDRAALISMAADLGTARLVLEETQRSSWRLIWEEEMKARFTSTGKPPAASTLTIETPIELPSEPEKPTTDVCNETESVVEVIKPLVNPVTLPRTVHHGGGRRWALDEKKNADLVHAHMTGKEARTMLPNLLRPKGAAGLWDLLVHSILKGYYGPPAHGTKSPGLHLVLPWLPADTFARSFDLRQLHDRKEVMEIVFPLLDRQPELREHPDQLALAVRDERRRIADERHKAAKLVRHQDVVKSHKFAVDEQEIIAFGEPLWPQDSPRYSYRDLCHACWYVNFWLGLAAAAKWSPIATGMQGRHLVKYLEPVSSGVVIAIYDVLNAYQQNPDGEKKIPTVPVNFGHA